MAPRYPAIPQSNPDDPASMAAAIKAMKQTIEILLGQHAAADGAVTFAALPAAVTAAGVSVAGPAGAQGQAGAPGFGVEGEDGRDGFPGQPGIQGPPGLFMRGSDGDDGDTLMIPGPSGIQGPPGLFMRGADGDDGDSLMIPGAQGVPGTTDPGMLAGLRLANNSTRKIDIATGKARDSTDVDNLVLSSVLTKDLNAAWAVGSTNGGLDTGAIAASTWYHVWLIKRVDTGVVDALFSTSATAPTMPTNYTLKRRIGSVKTDGSSNILAFTQNGDEFLWAVPVADYNLVAQTFGTAAILRTLSVPLGVQTTALFWGRLFDLSPGTSTWSLWTALDTTDTAATSLINNMIVVDTAAPGNLFQIRTDTSSQIRVRTGVSTAGQDYMSIVTFGWRDGRGGGPTTPTGPVAAPYCKIYLNANQTGVAVNAYTKINFDTVDTDPTGMADVATNHQVVPKTPGRYLVITTCLVDAGTAVGMYNGAAGVAKNGTRTQGATVALYSTGGAGGALNETFCQTSDVVSCNGTTDAITGLGAGSAASGAVQFSAAGVSGTTMTVQYLGPA